MTRRVDWRGSLGSLPMEPRVPRYRSLTGCQAAYCTTISTLALCCAPLASVTVATA